MASLYLNKVPPVVPYLSPALSVVTSSGFTQDGASPVLDIDPDPPASEFQYIQAVAGNDTNATFFDVHVQVWALACATAAASSLYLTSMGGTKGVLIPSGAAAQIDIGSLQEQPFTFNWDKNNGLTSTNPEITSHFVNNEVHCCMLANVFHPNDTTSAKIPDDPAGPLPQMQVATNRHHAQHNMTIRTHDAAESLAFHMFAANPVPDRDEVAVVRVTETKPHRLQEWELKRLDALGPWIRRTKTVHERGVAGVELVVDGKPRALAAARQPLKDLEVDIRHAGAGPERKLKLGADEARPMTINATIPREEFVLRTLDVTQTQGGKHVGGMRVMVVTVPESLRKPRGHHRPR